MTKTIDKQALGLAQKARDPKSSADHAEIVAIVKNRLVEHQARFVALSARRDVIVLEGRDVNAFMREMHDAQEELRIYEATLAEASRRHDEALAREARERVEADLSVVREIAVPRYEQGLRDMHAHLTAFLESARSVEAHRNAMEDMNMMAKANDRPDLVIDPDAVWEKVRAEIYEVPQSEPPVRFEGESDSAFNLRLINHAHRRDAAAWRDDPLKVVGEATIEAIEKTLLARSPFENTERRVEIQKFSDNGGTGHNTRITAVDGMRAPPKRLHADRPGLADL